MGNVWVKNLRTGLTWLVTKEHAERLIKSGDYELVKQDAGQDANEGKDAPKGEKTKKAR